MRHPYSGTAIKRSEVLTHGTAWMNRENIMPSEKSQTQKATCYDSIVHNVQNRQFHIDRKLISDCQQWGVGVGGQRMRDDWVKPLGTGVLLGMGDENVPKLDSGDDCTTLSILKIGEWYT